MRTFSSLSARIGMLALVALLCLVGAPASHGGQGPITTFVTNSGGSRMAFNITAIGQIKNTTGRLRKLFVITAASAGTLVINDVNSAGTAAIGNEVAALPNTLLTAGAIITLDAPVANGITISGTWPTALVLAASYD